MTGHCAHTNTQTDRHTSKERIVSAIHFVHLAEIINVKHELGVACNAPLEHISAGTDSCSHARHHRRLKSFVTAELGQERTEHYVIITFAGGKKVMFSPMSVVLFVCLSTRLLKKL